MVSRNASTDIKGPPKILEEVLLNELFGFIYGTFSSTHNSLEELRDQYWAPILIKGVEEKESE